LGTFLIGLAFELAGALLTTTSAAYDALFDDDGWQWALCEIYLKMDSTGQVPADEFVNIQSDFDSHFSGNAALMFSTLLNVWQLPGLNNAAKIPTADSLDCAVCSSECDASLWDVITYDGVPVGTVLSRTAHTITVQGTSHPDFGTPYNVMLITPDDSICCDIHAIEILTGSDVEYFGRDCDTPRWPGGPTGGITVPTVSPKNTLFLRGNSVPFTAKVTFA
jgi:hypothetical protein